MSAETDADWSLRRLLREVMGSGPKSADDMTYDQSRAAMAQILDGGVDPSTLGAFLLAARWKENTPAELAGFVDALRDRMDSAAPSADPVDCGANYDGKQTTALLGVAAGAVAAGAGVPVVVHSADTVPAKHGTTYRHVLAALDVETALDPADSARMVDETGVGYYAQPRFLPALHALLDRRDAIGVRTPINTVETLVDPADATVHLGSFYHRSFGHRMVETAAASRSLPVERVLLVQGLEGYDDVRPGRTQVTESRDGTVEDWTIETAEYGLTRDRNGLAVDDVVTDSARLTEAVLSGERRDGWRAAVELNAALRIYAGGAVETLEAGVETARASIDEGAAATVLEDLRTFEA